MSKIKIEVTASDIRKAKKLTKNMARAKCCPIALAIQRKLKDAGILVRTESVRLSNGGNIPLPEKAIDFISKFDDEKPVKPFSFMMTKEPRQP